MPVRSFPDGLFRKEQEGKLYLKIQKEVTSLRDLHLYGGVVFV